MRNFIAFLLGSGYGPYPPQGYNPQQGYAPDPNYGYAPQPPPGYYPQPGYAPAPGYGVPAYGMMPAPGYMMMPPPQEKSGFLTVGGVMNILGAVFLFIEMGYAASVLSWISTLSNASSSMMGSPLPSSATNYLAYLWGVCVILPLIGAIFAILGAVFMFKATKWGLAIAGGVLGMVAGIASGVVFVGTVTIPNPIGILAFIFCLIGVIAAAVCKKDFH